MWIAAPQAACAIEHVPIRSTVEGTLKMQLCASSKAEEVGPQQVYLAIQNGYGLRVIGPHGPGQPCDCVSMHFI